MKNISTDFLYNCCTANTSALGRATELRHSEGAAAQWLEANAKHPGPALRVNQCTLNHPQHWTLHKPATGSRRPLWQRGRARTQESPGCSSGLPPKENQNCYTGSPLPSPSSYGTSTSLRLFRSCAEQSRLLMTQDHNQSFGSFY